MQAAITVLLRCGNPRCCSEWFLSARGRVATSGGGPANPSSLPMPPAFPDLFKPPKPPTLSPDFGVLYYTQQDS